MQHGARVAANQPSPELPGQVRDAFAWQPSSPAGQLFCRLLVRSAEPRLLRAYQLSAGLSLVAANLVGALIIVFLNVFVIPGQRVPGGERGANASMGIVVVLMLAFLVGGTLIYRRSNAAWTWLRERREPTPREERGVLRAPLRVFRILLAVWLAATVLATIIAGVESARLALRIFLTTAIGGVVTAASGYLIIERIMRPAARVVLDHRRDQVPALPGVAARQMLTWALGTGSAVLGVWLVGVLHMTGISEATADRLARVMFVLASITLSIGLLAELATARAAADPIQRLRRAMQQITDGDFQARVEIDDATELGLLQTGFNRMAAGIQEREALRDLFGRHVGDDVANTALERGAQLGGETRWVAAMFVDIVGSTGIAMERPASEVVDLVNRFFETIVRVTDRHHGLVNKFAGDGALIVFGAPRALEDAATDALAAARELADALAVEVPETPATIGLSGGDVIAGNMGTAERFEYTVMGDPVNEAARLGSQAKRLPGRVAASGRLLEAASPSEAEHWALAHSVVLRGRRDRTDVAVPRTTLVEAPPAG